ncbi:MAG: SDR family NAD(P)-dependent oxidoreductase [Opitutales bacterium]
MNDRLFSLEGKQALVTGAGSGIGEAIARCFAGQGAGVVVADRDAAGGERVAAAIREAGGSARLEALDVTDEAACHKVVTAAAPDILVNNAGIGHVGTILTTTADDLDRLYAVNVRGVFHCCKAAATGMIERGGGSIINLASIGGIVGVRDRLAYCTTKFAVVGLTKTMALDHAADGLRVNAICPGRVETPFVQARLAEYPDPEAAYREMSATQPIGRMGRPDEIAACAAFLASDAAPLITGETLMADGGWSAG